MRMTRREESTLQKIKAGGIVMKAIILAGGSGTRLWPLSRKTYPKQFLSLGDKESFLQKTVKRILTVLNPEDVFIITNTDYKFLVKNQIEKINPTLRENILLEPVGRNTAPAVALAVKYLLEVKKVNESETVFISPSDHIINPEDAFGEYLLKMDNLAKNGFLGTFGIKPTKPETGYGYIEKGEKISEGFKVKRFVEKPNLEKAVEYLQSGNFYWNSGMFAFTIKDILDEFEKHAPEIYEKIEGKSYEDVLNAFTEMPDISLDYAVMEKTDKAAVIPLDLQWSDVGSWESIYELLPKDDDNNAVIGNALTIETKDSLILTEKRLISTIGLEGVMVIETPDALLIAKKGEAQKVKEVVSKLKEQNLPHSEEHLTTFRPWGSYTVLEEGPRYKIKRIVVNPGQKLSLQFHYHRSEHWVVVKGTALVEIDGVEKYVYENENIFVPPTKVHRLANPGKVPLEIIEIQVGSYVGEDDIVRVEDVYGRVFRETAAAKEE